MDLHEALWSPIALRPPYLLDFRHKKRRPWTSLDDEVVGRGNLNRFCKLLIYNVNSDFNFLLEYQLEYCTPLDQPFAFDLTSTLRNHDWQ